MRMIHGSALFGKGEMSNPELLQAENRNVARMLAAVEDCPWQGRDVKDFRAPQARAVFGLQFTDESAAPTGIQSLGDLTIVADVRLDNRAELASLLGLGAPANGAVSDAELILRAYQKWGADCASHLLGDFAFVIWDAAARRIFCARDFVGVRPFYFHHNPREGRFVFSSDLISITAHRAVPTELNLAYVAGSLQVLIGQFYTRTETYFQEIQKLEPAHCLLVDANGLKSWAYWQPAQLPERRYANEREYVDELRALLHTAVADRIQSPHPVGAHISGGLDSSSMAVIGDRILREHGRTLTGFSWAPPLPDDLAALLPNDERKLVEAVRAAEDFPIEYNRLTGAHVLAHMRRDYALQPTTTLQFELATSEHAARLGIRTFLSGWGGDELIAFNGRGYFADLLRRGRWVTLFRELRQRGELQGSPVWKQLIVSGVLPLLPGGLVDRIKPDDAHPRIPPPPPNYLQPEFAKALSSVKPLTKPESHEMPGIRRMQLYLFEFGHLSYRMESWYAHGARQGMTYVFPLTDKRIAEFALSIPDYFFFKNGWKRYLYRTAMEGILPDVVRWAKVKEDPAMSIGMRDAQRGTAEQAWADLNARVDNPYIDVDKFRAALEANAALPVAERQNVGRARWLAFLTSTMYKGA